MKRAHEPAAAEHARSVKARCSPHEVASCWDDLIDDTKELIRRACPEYTQCVLSMTCKAEYAEKPPVVFRSKTNLVRSMLASGDYGMLEHINLGKMGDDLFHKDIIHFAIFAGASLPIIKWLFHERDNEDGQTKIIPCSVCFETGYKHKCHGLDAFLVEILIDMPEEEINEDPVLDEIKCQLMRGATDMLLGRFCRYFG